VKVRNMALRHILVATPLLLLTHLAVAGVVEVDFAPFNCDSSYCSNIAISVVQVVDDGRVHFEFQNNSTVESSIARIYFEKGPLTGIAGFEFGPGTLFAKDARPIRLPGGQLLEPVFDTAYSARSIAPIYQNGIGPGECLTIIFNLDDNANPEELFAHLQSGIVRIGAHVIGLPDGSSFSAVTTPEPGTILLLGLGCLIFIRKARAHSQS